MWGGNNNPGPAGNVVNEGDVVNSGRKGGEPNGHMLTQKDLDGMKKQQENLAAWPTLRY